MTTTEQRFYELLKADNTDTGDVERMQLFYLISRIDELWEASTRIYDVKTHCTQEGWKKVADGKTGKMLRRAMHLYNCRNKDISTVDLFKGLDSWNTETMINAQMIYCECWNYNNPME